MPPKTPAPKRREPDILPDLLPGKDREQTLPDDPRREPNEMTPDSLPGREPRIPTRG